jgi:hypothetical protein
MAGFRAGFLFCPLFEPDLSAYVSNPRVSLVLAKRKSSGPGRRGRTTSPTTNCHTKAEGPDPGRVRSLSCVQLRPDRGHRCADRLLSSVITCSTSHQSSPAGGPFVPKGSRPRNAIVPERQKQPYTQKIPIRPCRKGLPQRGYDCFGWKAAARRPRRYQRNQRNQRRVEGRCCPVIQDFRIFRKT